MKRKLTVPVNNLPRLLAHKVTKAGVVFALNPTSNHWVVINILKTGSITVYKSECTTARYVAVFRDPLLSLFALLFCPNVFST